MMSIYQMKKVMNKEDRYHSASTSTKHIANAIKRPITYWNGNTVLYNLHGKTGTYCKVHGES